MKNSKDMNEDGSLNIKSIFLASSCNNKFKKLKIEKI